MTAPIEEPPRPPNALALHRQLVPIWDSGAGLKKLSAVNHTVLGIRFMVTALVFFAIGGLLGMLMRVQLATPEAAFMDAETYNQVFTMHGSTMMFLFAIPMLEGIAVYLTPKLLGTRDFAFPRLTAFGYWCYLFGGTILVVSLLGGVAPDGGWFMYTPLSSDAYSPGKNADVWLLGVTFVEISALTLAVEIVVSVLKMRAPGMTLDRMPIFGWYILVTSMMMILGFPPLILASMLLEVERAFGLPFFDPTRGGDPLLWQHLFWLFGHPDVYIIFLPAAGLLSTMIPVFAQRALIGYRAIVVAIVALGFVSFGIWVHHMFTVGIPHLALAFFSIASAVVAVPTAVQIFAWLATLAHGRPRWDVPMLYVFGFFFVFVCGGLTGVMIAMVPFNWQAHDTYFIVAHMHYVLVGSFAFPLFGALYYWLPLLTGRAAMHGLAVPAFWLIFIGFNMTFFMMHLTGLLGMPRRIYTYPGHEGWIWLNLLSSVGAFVMTIGFGLIAIDLIAQVRLGRRARRNPWNAGSLEWAIPRPATPYAFGSLPHIETRADQLAPAELAPKLARGEGYLGFTRNGWMEGLGVHMTSGKPEQLIVLPSPTYLPLLTALALAAMVLAMLFSLYPLAILAAAVTIGLFMLNGHWAGLREDHVLLSIGRGVALPPHTEVVGNPAWWSVVLTLVADGAFFASLLFGALFLWISAPMWPPATTPEPDLVQALIIIAGLAVAAVAARGATRALERGASPTIWQALATAALLVSLTIAVIMILNVVPDPRTHALGASAAALLAYVVLHAGIGLLFIISNYLRLAAGYLSPRRSTDLRMTRLWLDYTLATGIIAIGLVLSLPALVAMLEARP